MTTLRPERRDELLHEARLFSRYLLGGGVTVSEEAALRYARADERLFADDEDARETAVVTFCRRHPWATGPLEAASGLLRPESLLRRKLLVMTAVLETSPEHAEAFLPARASLPALVGRLGALGAAATLKAALGTLLLPLASRARP